MLDISKYRLGIIKITNTTVRFFCLFLMLKKANNISEINVMMYAIIWNVSLLVKVLIIQIVNNKRKVKGIILLFCIMYSSLNDDYYKFRHCTKFTLPKNSQVLFLNVRYPLRSRCTLLKDHLIWIFIRRIDYTNISNDL